MLLPSAGEPVQRSGKTWAPSPPPAPAPIIYTVNYTKAKYLYKHIVTAEQMQ